MRHGIAHERETWTQHDSLRPLTSNGIDKTRAAAHGLKIIAPPLQLIASSPLIRAIQTAQIVREELTIEAEIAIWPELELADVEQIMGRLHKIAFGSSASTCGVLLIGHEPGLSELIAQVLFANENDDGIAFKKASVCALNLEFADFEMRAQLQWFLKPNQLRLIGAK